jgi:hypothetical protein
MRTLWAWLGTHKLALGAAAVTLSGALLDPALLNVLPTNVSHGMVIVGSILQAVAKAIGPAKAPADA